MRYFNEEGKEREIGIIKRLADFPEDQQQLILDNLNKHYYEQVIQRVHHVESEYGLLFFDVETQRGPGAVRYALARGLGPVPTGIRARCSSSRWATGTFVPNIDDLPPVDQRRFRSVIYW